MAAGFFRKSALEKLSTPEKLDQLIKVTGPKAWIALLTVSLALSTGLAWAVFGKVKTKLNAIGVVLGGQVHEVVSTSNGQLIKLKVGIGDKVKEGDIIAAIQQPELSQQIEGAKAVLTDRKLEMGKLMSYGSQGSQLEGELISQNRVSIQGEIEAEKKKLSFLNNQLESENNLLTKGLIIKSQVANTKQQIDASLNTIERLKGQLVEISNRKLNIGFDLQQKITLQNQRIAEAERNLQFLTERYDKQSNIRSSYSGEVVEVLTDVGVVVGAGTPLFKLKNQDEAKLSNKLKGVLYIPSQDGKKIKKGMEAFVVPSTVQPQEYGFIKGKVTYISDFPITQQGMMTSVKNDQLAKGLLSSGPLFEVHVEFDKDSNSYSGFKWTSAKGPDIAIKEGTSCTGKITIKQENPASIVVPAFKKFFDLY
ncbi:NHLP bacteriocin system secretion protein [Arcicella sp. LKC2W]|uniref:NHLP bacteriocin system secretion protein n=1 Tax=Arcicella sp. LKC2W TaxID=2984198 RepID=UPI002B1FC789|nr:NHLP bacteriocin system secretion protein [Arcicella sp. LKC2W]MEA5461130.1 NHLP bacteriocin system secretion protein [Arcicella sp. LKC2W]